MAVASDGRDAGLGGAVIQVAVETNVDIPRSSSSMVCRRQWGLSAAVGGTVDIKVRSGGSSWFKG